jgi:zinc finger-containing ubiquitin peptidase 1
VIHHLLTIAMEPFSCPFCDFADGDSYSLLQHVELIHPENGESPFIATEQDEEESRSSSSKQESSGKEVALQDKQTQSSSTLSLENPATYIECPYNCGELVASAELTSHTDFHLAENMAFEEETLRPLQFSTGACNDEQAVNDISSHFSTDIPKALRRDDNSFRTLTPRKSSLKELLFGGSPRRTPTKVSGGGTKRLGVSSRTYLRLPAADHSFL